MVKYAAQRFAQAAFALLILTMIIFAMVHATGDPASMLVDENATQEDVIRIRKSLGLDKPYVIHKDFDKKNNKVENLMYVDRKELTEHNKKNPAVIAAKKKALKNPKYSKLTAGRVKLIKQKIFDPNRKTRMRMIAKQFGISEMQLYRIKSGENWGHVDYDKPWLDSAKNAAKE